MARHQTQNVFAKQLKLALKNLNNPTWLAAESPLASPYFLSVSAQSTPNHLGKALQHVITTAVRSLWSADGPRDRQQIEAEMSTILRNIGDPRYHYLVLELRYVQQYFRPRRLAQIWEEFLGVSRAEFYRDIDEAIDVLGKSILHSLHPTFRPETPTVVGPLIGRNVIIDDCLARLRGGSAVSLSGAGGVGKTTLGSAVAAQWDGPVFWYTIRPTLNDTLNSLLYALGYFLHTLEANGLWEAILAGKGRIADVHLAAGLVRHDLASIQAKSPLLCFDEFDRLRPLDADNPVRQHVQLLEFIEQLTASAPLLLIGQHPVLDTPTHHAVTGLTVAHLSDLLRQEKLSFKLYESAELHNYTGGIPRLVQLVIALRRDDESISDLLRQLPQSPTLEPLLDRLFARSTAGERQLLQTLSVFRSPAPGDSLSSDTPDLTHLLQRHLVQQDTLGGVTMWPALRDVINSRLSAERREQYHLQAAAIRATHGEFTAASYHYQQAGYDKEAVQFWFPRRQQEIERGQATAALTIFQQISVNHLPHKTAEALALLRAELKQLEGDMTGGSAELRSVTFKGDTEIALRAHEFRGQFLNALGYPDQALTSYEEGLTTAARIGSQLVRFRNRRSRVHVRQGSLEPAQREAQLAQFEALNLQGVILGKQGRYTVAYAAHAEALALAETLAYTRGMAQAHHDMATLLVYQGDIDRVISHTRQATKYYTQIGDRHFAEMARINMAATLIQAQRFAEAAEEARTALSFFDQVGDPYGRATAAANLAEAYCELNQLDEAQQYAQLVLQQEEPHTIPFALYTLGTVAHKRGNNDQAIHYYAASAEYGADNGEKFIQAYALRALGKLLSDNDTMEQGLIYLDQARALFTELKLLNEVAAT